MISQINIDPCDVLCICGDIIGLNDQRDMQKSEYWWTHKFVDWVNKQPCDRVIITVGNHDFYIESLYKSWELNDNYINFLDTIATLTNGKLVLLIDNEYIYKGIKFYGTPWINQINFQESRWAFEDKSAYLADGFSLAFSTIPKDVDVLLTHDSPIRNKNLAHYTKDIKYQAHFYGHWHGDKSYPFENKYNCSYLDDNYGVENKEMTLSVVKRINENKVIELKLLENLLAELKTSTDYNDRMLKLTSIDEDNITDIDHEEDGMLTAYENVFAYLEQKIKKLQDDN